MTVSLFPVVTHYWYVWCDDHSGCIFNIAVCKTEKEAMSTRGYWSEHTRTGDKTFTITREKNDYHQNH